MSELSPKARALLQAQRKALRPTATDRERIEAALRTKLGESALPSTQVASRAASKLPVKAITGMAVGACLLGAVAWRALQPEPTPSEPTAIVAAPSPQPQAAPLTTSSQPEPPPTAATPAASPKAKAKAKTPTRTPDRLAVEVELLSRATSALRSGNFRAALEILDEHQHSFPRGALQQERSIAKAQALCSLGRVQEGRAELEHLPPGTPATARARLSCSHQPAF